MVHRRVEILAYSLSVTASFFFSMLAAFYRWIGFWVALIGGGFE